MCSLKSTCIHRDTPSKCSQCQKGNLSYQSDPTIIDIIGGDKESEKSWRKRKQANNSYYIDYSKMEVT